MPEEWQFEKNDSGFICVRDANNDITSITANEDGKAVTAWLNYMYDTISQLVKGKYNIIYYRCYV